MLGGIFPFLHTEIKLAYRANACMYVGGINVSSGSQFCSDSQIIMTVCKLCVVCDSLCVFLWFSGIRTEQDLYVRLIDSMTKQVRRYKHSEPHK